MADKFYTFNNKILVNNNKILKAPSVDPYNPLGLPPYTIRVRYTQGITPSFSKGAGALVDAENNIWDLTYEKSNWSRLFVPYIWAPDNNLIEIVGSNSESVTSMYELCYNCTGLKYITQLDTRNVQNIDRGFISCFNVESGALALYQQMSTQDKPTSWHAYTFRDCGRDTVSGAAELAQIPSDWK